MSQDFNDAQRGDSQIRQFEKNQFFQGKLMTARDMQAEQEYHADRLHALTRFAVGKGILYGAEISGVEETENELRVTLEPGIVIDGYGRPIVIEYTTTKTLPMPSGDELYLFLRYSETDLESVPVPEVRGASSEEFMPNRTVETFELTYQESPPDSFDEVPAVDTSVPDNAEAETVLRALANRYHQRHRSRVRSVDDPSIFVGSFERTRDGSWIRGPDTIRRNLVYDNDMLYATLISHVTDTKNPHNISERGITGDVSEGIEEMRDVNRRLQDVQERLDVVNRYVMRKTLKDEIRYFEVLADSFEEDDPEASQIAREIVDRASDGIDAEVSDDPEAYREQIGEMLELHINLGEVLQESVTEESLERYVRAVNELQSAIADDAGALHVAEAQDKVCESADSLTLLIR